MLTSSSARRSLLDHGRDVRNACHMIAMATPTPSTMTSSPLCRGCAFAGCEGSMCAATPPRGSTWARSRSGPRPRLVTSRRPCPSFKLLRELLYGVGGRMPCRPHAAFARSLGLSPTPHSLRDFSEASLRRLFVAGRSFDASHGPSVSADRPRWPYRCNGSERCHKDKHPMNSGRCPFSGPSKSLTA
jgi:hypothetical protein